MSIEINNDDDVVIRISHGSRDVVQPQTLNEEQISSSHLRDGHKSYRRIGIEITKTTRNSFHGLTEVQTLALGNDLQYGYILDILNNPSIRPKLSSLLNLIYQLGCSQDPEKQFFAATTMERLSQSQPFSELNSKVIMEWAKDENPTVQKNAVRSLLLLIKHESCQREVLTLLNAWITSPNPNLMESALKVYSGIDQSFPRETLQAIEFALARKNLPLGRVMRMVERIYALYPDMTIDILHKWLVKNNVSHLKTVAESLLLSMVQIDDVVRNHHLTATTRVPNLEDKIIEMVILLWDQQKSAVRILNKLRHWVYLVLSKPEQEKPLYLHFFHKLYYQCKNASNNWFAYYVALWQKEYDYEQQRQAKFSKSKMSFDSSPQLNFRSVIPDNKI